MFQFSFVSCKNILLDISRGVFFIVHKGTLLNQNTPFGGFCGLVKDANFPEI